MKTIHERMNELTFHAEQLFQQTTALRDELMFTDAPPIEPDIIKEKCNEVFEVADLAAPTRKKEVCYARHAAAFLLKMFTKKSLENIALTIGQHDHTSALHSIQTCKDLMDTDENYKRRIHQLVTYFQLTAI